MVYAASIRKDIDSLLAKASIFSIVFSQALFMPSLSFKFSKAAKLFEMVI